MPALPILPRHDPSPLRLLPGVLLCATVASAAFGLQHLQALAFRHVWVESVALAIIIGTAVRTAWRPADRWLPGIVFSAKVVLELAVVLLGAALNAEAVLAIGPALLAGIVLLVGAVIATGYAIGRTLRLPHRLALLVACGNAICGNSAIAAMAPTLGADGEEMAAAITFTAVLGILVVLGLPLLMPVFGYSQVQYGVFAGLTVYAVPQVLAATAPVGALSVQVGTLVKLMRVLMLGPVVLAFALGAARARNSGRVRLAVHRLVPWFILGFLGLGTLRSAGLLPVVLIEPAADAASLLTVLSMAALGLTVDARAIGRAGGRVAAAACLSLAALGAASVVLIAVLGVA